DRLDETASVARADLGIAIEHPEHGVGLVDRIGLLQHDLVAVVAGDGQIDGSLIFPRAEPAARDRGGAERQGGRERAGTDHFRCFPFFSPGLRTFSQLFATLSLRSATTLSLPPPQKTRSRPPPLTMIRSAPAPDLTPSLPPRGRIRSSPSVPLIPSGPSLPRISRPRSSGQACSGRAST